MDKVAGHCPMGCGETLFLGDGGHVTCSWTSCPMPNAVDRILGDSEAEHIVEIKDDSFTIQHPLRERLDGKLYACGLHRYLQDLDGPPRWPGTYRVFDAGELGYNFEAVE